MEAVKDGLGGLSEMEIRPAAQLASGSYNYFENGDILLAKVTPCFENGKKALAAGLENGAGYATSEVHVIRPKRSKIEPRFLLYLLSAEDFRAEGMASMTGAGGLRRVSEAAILNYRPKVTDLATQKAIADFLDRETARIGQLIEKKQRLVEVLNEHVVAEREAAVWGAGAFSKLGHHISILPGYAFPSSGFSENPEDIRLLRGANVNVDAVRWDDVVYWPIGEIQGLARFMLREGDIVMGMDRPWISSGIRVAKVEKEDVPSLLLQRVCKITPSPNLGGEFLMALLESRRFLAHFEPILTGVSVPHISGDQIASFRFPFIEIEEQEYRISQLRRVKRQAKVLKLRIDASIERLREYRAALITAAVTGQIDVETYGKQGATDRTLDRIEEEMGG